MSWRALLALLALVAFATAQEAQPEPRDALLARWQEALDLGEEAQLAREAPQLLEARAELRKDGDVLALYARALARTGGAERARELLLEAQPTKATLPARELALARLELDADQLPAVVRRLARPDPESPVRYPERAESWVLLGKARYRAGDTAGAVPLLERFVGGWRLHPDGPSAWHLLSQAALARRDVQRAREFRDRAQSLASWHAFYKTRRIQVREAPKDPLPRFGLAQLWASVEELGRARAELERVFALDPEFARAWALLGEVERKAQSFELAIRAYDRALELDATLSEARHNRALLALLREDDAAARIDLEILLEGPEAAEPKYLGAHLALARLLQRAGDEDAARERHARYVELGGTEEL